ncbi:MAG: phage holin family protein [Actinomycetota bacterium]|nr:phage holin family protein [Actinomycetota bacterium]
MPDSPQPSIMDLVSKTVTDAKRLAKANLALAQAEMKASRNAMTSATALGLVSLISAPLVLMFLLFTIVYVLVQLGLQTWAAFGIVTLLLLGVTLLTALLARNQARKIKGPALAIREMEKTSEAFAPTDTPS